MKDKNRFTFHTFIFCILTIAALGAAYFFMADRALQEMDRALGTLAGEAGTDVSSEATKIVNALNPVVNNIRTYGVPVMTGSAGLAVLLFWVLVQISGRRIIEQAGVQKNRTAPAPGRQQKSPKEKADDKASPGPAVQLLSLLQRQGRLVDFLEEDLTQYDDSQIGAAVRSIHAGCNQALKEHIQLERIFEEEEDAPITVPKGFNGYEIRLTGNITGDPPFKGTLRHHGWKVKSVELPQTIGSEQGKWIVEPAEVEVTA